MNELELKLTTTGLTLVALIRPASDRRLRWNGVSLVQSDTIVDADWATGLIPTVEDESHDGTLLGLYVGDFPIGITLAGEYTAYFYEGVAPTPGQAIVGKQDLSWDGRGGLVTIADNIYTCEIRFLRDQSKLRDNYTAQWLRNGKVVSHTDISLPNIIVDKDDGVRIINNKSMTTRTTSNLVVYSAMLAERLPLGDGARVLMTCQIDGQMRSWPLAIGRDA